MRCRIANSTAKLTAINSTVDPSTRNVSLQATLDNPDHALRPGMFAKVEVILPTKQQDALHSGDGGFLCALWQFGFRDREKEGRKNRARNR